MAGGMSSANARQGRTRKRQYDAYKFENRYTKNKVKKLQRHLRRFPMDAAAADMLVIHGKDIGKDFKVVAFDASRLLTDRKLVQREKFKDSRRYLDLSK